jgi:hypothetical protein
LLAWDFLTLCEFTELENTLDNIPIRFHLSNEEEFDLTRVKNVYGILEARSIFGLNSSDLDSLRLYSESIGQSSSLSRSILALVDTIYTPTYFIPEEINPRSSFNKTNGAILEGDIELFPFRLQEY